KIPDDVFRELEIAALIELMDLLFARQRMAERAGRAVVFQAQVQPLTYLVAEMHGRLEFPAVLRARTAQRSREHRIEVELPVTKYLLNDRPQLKGDGIFFIFLRRGYSIHSRRLGWRGSAAPFVFLRRGYSIHSRRLGWRGSAAPFVNGAVVVN